MPKAGLKNVAYDYLHEGIMNYIYGPDDAIVEQDISNHLGISRTPVREALKLLEAEGLVTHIRSRGTFVKEITAQDIEEIMELRILFEKTALKSAIHMIKDEELNEIEQKMRELEQDTSFEEYYAADRDLHMCILNYSRNTRLITFHGMIASQLERLRRISSRTPDRLAKSRNEHLAIVQSIRERDFPRAEAKLVEHLTNIKNSTLNVYHSIRVNRVR